mmetsp:Transcript_4361/g.8451  ORF Transcript_4361/g.8451 Transcript_4361/m.8451 type:complete len:523 (-) Transcript_4361:167-1735(-)|eukprot:CAMPEP_0113309044 /NCGR_PEP_ID=MMETSP0010_2-20120614/7249_1 /TAXON_ID=216773 ORGANISM="Corethron hystrix, Strain 308" /NCGR_SAMPLE_ID=MMETSP0010_2 /ASSEMBLY_ACC=CAM_ASM_000155 /LENGTH=522 /DNA_ID=CAMNT_0000164225 /DNA_START=227 /DNA_END=1798 /DNA_ORIENTATION=- /assembly_acc=CAM_ASM_000155
MQWSLASLPLFLPSRSAAVNAFFTTAKRVGLPPSHATNDLRSGITQTVSSSFRAFASRADAADAIAASKKNADYLHDADADVWSILELEENRQRRGLELIASENFASSAVRAALGSCMTNKYSEGYVGRRYYGGNEHVDALESLCISRALDLYGLNPSEWSVNVQPYSGSPANFAAYHAILEPHDRIMGLELSAGGHLTHGFMTASGRRVSATSVYWESLPYTVKTDGSGLIDYDDMEYRASIFRPKILIAGGSAYPREWDYARMRSIADKVGALLMTDMAHISGLVAGGAAASPFPFSDVVTTTTHKSLRGPRAGMIFSRGEDLPVKIDAAVFPGLQGGPHNHQIAALAVALGEAKTPSFQKYTEDIVGNAAALAEGLIVRGHVVATGGTTNHMLLWDARPLGLNGSQLEAVLDAAAITANKNSLPGDVSAVTPGGVRLGTPALTSRGLGRGDFDVVAGLLDRAANLAVKVKGATVLREGKKKVLLKDFIAVLSSFEEVVKLKEDVETFASNFYMPGDEMR